MFVRERHSAFYVQCKYVYEREKEREREGGKERGREREREGKI